MNPFSFSIPKVMRGFISQSGRLAFAIAVLGCSGSGPEEYRISLGESLSESQASAVYDVATEWSRKVSEVGGRLRFTFEPVCSGWQCIHVEAHSLPAPLLGQEFFQEDDSAMVYVGIDAPDPRLKTVVAHELGHAIGLHHTEPGSVMCSSAECAAPGPMARDARQFLYER